MTTPAELETIFPALLLTGYRITSQDTPEYNCIAWAAGDNDVWWWPDSNNLGYWPSTVPREESANSFIEAYGTLGYTVCDSPDFEQGFEKIAIYFKDGKPTHAARQLTTGKWTSKLGKLEDIEHDTLNGVENHTYGAATIFMRRQI